jgi:hypothetical protein
VHAIDQVLDEAVRRGERWMSIGRIFFSLAAFSHAPVRHWLCEDEGLAVRGWLIVSMGACFIAFSLWLIGRTLRGPIPRWILGLSVVVDAIMGCVALLGNALWPSPNYLSNFKSLDWALLLLVIVISGFRLSPRVLWLSVGLNTMSAATLIYADCIVLGKATAYLLGAEGGNICRFGGNTGHDRGAPDPHAGHGWCLRFTACPSCPACPGHSPAGSP